MKSLTEQTVTIKELSASRNMVKTLSSLCKTQQEEIKGYRKGLEVGGGGGGGGGGDEGGASGASGANATAPTTTALHAPAPATTEAALVAAAAAAAAEVVEATADPAKTATVAEVEGVREGGGSPTIMSTPEMELAYDDI